MYDAVSTAVSYHGGRTIMSYHGGRTILSTGVVDRADQLPFI